MFRLRHVIALMTNAVLVGSLPSSSAPAGRVGADPRRGLIGFLLSWPAAILVARWIKTDDPAWNESTTAGRASRRRARGRAGAAS